MASTDRKRYSKLVLILIWATSYHFQKCRFDKYSESIIHHIFVKGYPVDGNHEDTYIGWIIDMQSSMWLSYL
ncbi:MAG: hypothetical protein DA329_00665 [Candidatus Nitrosocosmicus sp.]|nr:hypothetical protein [Candidatus Nitrosocosmicus sp.]